MRSIEEVVADLQGLIESAHSVGGEDRSLQNAHLENELLNKTYEEACEYYGVFKSLSLPREADPLWYLAYRVLYDRLTDELRKRNKAFAAVLASENARFAKALRCLEEVGLTCPRCGRHSKDFRVMNEHETRPHYFICRSCGSSCYPDEVG